VYFDVKWLRWLAETIPGARRRVEFKRGRTFSLRNIGKSATKNCARIGRRRNRKRDDSLLNRGAWNWIPKFVTRRS
jgi:hypothetical protein